MSGLCKHLMRGAPDCVFCHRDQLQQEIEHLRAYQQQMNDILKEDERLRAALAEALGNYTGLRTLLRSVQINAVVPDELMADIEHAIGPAK